MIGPQILRADSFGVVFGSGRIATKDGTDKAGQPMLPGFSVTRLVDHSGT